MTPRGVTDADAGFMGEAIAEASKGLGRTHPNPTVGVVIVQENGSIVGRGFHRRAGAPHAEVMALKAAGAQARGATLYSTLEPCGHFGRTPPCSDAILKAGIARVVYASRDPNPLVNGRGLRALKAQGVVVNGPLLQSEADALNRPFFKFIQTGLPFVTLKVASTLDGKLASATGESKWLSSEASRVRVHHLRNRVDVVLIGSNTARIDDPQLTTRLKMPGTRNAVRIVLDGGLTLSAQSLLVKTARKIRTIVATMASPRAAHAKKLARAGVELWYFKPSKQGIPVQLLLERIADARLLHVLVEGGADVHSRFLKAHAADEIVQFIVPKVLGAEAKTWTGELGIKDLREMKRFRMQRVERVGDDVMIVSTPEWARP